MKAALLSGVAALTLSLSLSPNAQAADMKIPVKAPPATVAPVVASPDWSGVYIGINAGIADSNGVMVGGTLGYNYQSGPLVLGVEGDIDATWADPDAPYLDTIRGRVGYALDQFLPYLTAGGAYSNGTWGTVYGGGIEVRLIQALSAKVEYLHADAHGPDDIVRVGLNWRFNIGGPLATPIATRY